MSKRGLTDKQRGFIKARIKGLNQTQAAREAGYSGDDNALAVDGSRLLGNAKIVNEIEAHYKRQDISIDYYLRNLKSYIDSTTPNDAPSDKAVAVVCLKQIGEFLARCPVQPNALDNLSLTELESRLREMGFITLAEAEAHGYINPEPQSQKTQPNTQKNSASAIVEVVSEADEPEAAL